MDVCLTELRPRYSSIKPTHGCCAVMADPVRLTVCKGFAKSVGPLSPEALNKYTQKETLIHQASFYTRYTSKTLHFLAVGSKKAA